MEEKRRKL